MKGTQEEEGGGGFCMCPYGLALELTSTIIHSLTHSSMPSKSARDSSGRTGRLLAFPEPPRVWGGRTRTTTWR